MARYFFDICDENGVIRDTRGCECDGQDGVRGEVMGALPSLARDAIPQDGDKQSYTILVRNESNQTIYTATLSFSGIWLGEDALPVPEDAGE